MSKKLSIITINYNDKIGLEKTIQSVINQTWKEFEFIVIDGNSTDGSKQIIEKYKSHISFWKSESDTGVYNAMNKGIETANGKYLIFMNGGDIFFDFDVLNKINKNLDEDYSIIYGNSACYEKDIYIRNEIPPSKLSLNFFYVHCLNHQSCFIKKDILVKYNCYNESNKICSDWEFYINAICLNNESYNYINQFICNYDMTGMSANPKNKIIFQNERELIFTKYFPLVIDDYKNYNTLLTEFNSKKIRNIFHIKKFTIPWKILSKISRIMIFFLPKNKF